MFLILIDNDKQINKKLDKNPYCYKGIRVSFDKSYYIELEDGYFIKDLIEKKIPLELKHYEIFCNDEFDSIHIFMYEDECDINKYILYENNDFLLTNNEKAEIVNTDKYQEGFYITLKNNTIKTNSNYLYINNKRENHKLLKNGDYVHCLGFSMYYYDDFLYINNFLISSNKLKLKEIKEEKLKYKTEIKTINQSFPEPIVNLNIEEIKECDLPKDKNQRSFLIQIGPSLTMSFAMLGIAFINFYNNSINGSNKIGSLVFLMMPLTMLLSGVIWPLINLKSETNKFKEEFLTAKDNYLNYLKFYKKRQTENIQKYRDRLSNDILNLNNFYLKLFTYNSKNPAYLKLFIGYTDIENSFIINKTGDDDIDKELEEIDEIINNVSNIPLFIDLNKTKNITIVTNPKFKDYYFNLYLLELSYKHHYDDIVIAIYKKDLSKIPNIPHLFFNNNRFTFNNERQLQELNTVRINKPVILFIYDKPSFKINHPLFKCIYFSGDENDLLYESDSILKYYSSCGYLINSGKIKFNYFYKDYNFNYYFNLIEKYKNINLVSKIYNFKNRDDNYLIKDNYTNKQISLKADFAYVDDELLSFDLHETKQGPHGLIGGTTGSGKSELLISFILSLCIRYRPDYVNIILIDYKGEGIKDSLTFQSEVLPHIVANISNLEKDAFERLIIKIRNECKLRQRLFNKLSSLTSLSIVNIDDYLENNKSLNNMAHLVIIVDEFAELKKEYPELMKELVSLSRIGRSLGVHLILATQRPSGVIDDEIWSNSHFKIALKVHSEKDSQDLIKTKDAAYLSKAGEFYLQVDNSTIKARSIYSKNDISGKEKIEVAILDNCLNIENKLTVNNPHPIIESNYIVKTILKICKELHIGKNTLDFEKHESKTYNELTNKYGQNKNKIILGEIDDYLNGKHDLLTIDNKENILIYSSRNHEIDNILNNLILDNRKIIIISNQKYENPLIVDSVLYEDEENIAYLLNKLTEYNGENITLVIEDFSCFVSYSDNYQEKIYHLLQRKETVATNVIILSKKSTFNFKILNSINNKYVIKMMDNQDLLNIYYCQSKYKGDSYFQKEELISFIPIKIDKFNNSCKCTNEFIRKIPLDIMYSYKLGKLLIGFSKKDRKEIYLDDSEKILITSFTKNIIDRFKVIYSNNNNVVVEVYNNKIQTEMYKYIIWLGNGRDKQMIFYDDIKTPIKKNEGIYIKEGVKEIIKVINYE